MFVVFIKRICYVMLPVMCRVGRETVFTHSLTRSLSLRFIRFDSAASSVAGSADLLSFPVSSASSSAGSSRLRLPHVVGYYETDSRKPFPKDSKKCNVSVDQLKAAIVRLATHAGGANLLAADGIPASWAAFAQHVASIKEQAPNMPCISYDEVTLPFARPADNRRR